VGGKGGRWRGWGGERGKVGGEGVERGEGVVGGDNAGKRGRGVEWG